MSSITTVLKNICTHRELVAAYYHRPSECWVITGTAKSAGGAVVVNNVGEIIRTCSSKRDALASLHGSNVAVDLTMQDVRGSRAWAEQQIRITATSKRPMTLKRVNQFLSANDFPEVE